MNKATLSEGELVLEDSELIIRTPNGDAVIGMLYGVDDFPCYDPENDEEEATVRAQYEQIQRQILASGKLLEALKKVYAYLMECTYFPGNMALMTLLAQTIAKAEGKANE